MVVGNVRESTLVEIWNGTEMIRLRREAAQARKALVTAQAGGKPSEPESPSAPPAEVN